MESHVADWNLIWTAIACVATVVGLLGGLILFLHSSLKQDFKSLEEDLKNVEKTVNNIDRRLNHLEGSFEERGRWESRKI